MVLSLSFMNFLFLEITGVWVAYAYACNIEKYRGQGLTSGRFGGACAPFAHPGSGPANDICIDNARVTYNKTTTKLALN